MLANLREKPVSDYGLTGSDSHTTLPIRTFTVTTLLGSRDFEELQKGADGQING